MNGAPARNDVELSLLEGMVDGAHALGMRIVQAAEAEPNVQKLLTLTEAFNRCFHAVRMGIRLCITLRAAPKPAAVSPPARAEAERERAKDHRDHDRERDRDYEPVSLDRFLATLRGVTRDAERLQVGAGDAAQLQRLLAEVDAGPTKPTLVMAGLVPATQKHRSLKTSLTLSTAPTPLPPAHLGGRDKPGHDGQLGRARPPPPASG